ncbi:uncharacterized protein N7483_011544 [Penicillium malachiteum]|uniref:uncharacterized protein n=1 Tax=Penicillium malachiteum TaxID=1324776 RepID=UPI00254774E9|nr:uncharacterized protein N7483_011544 [Penicillium malachiteum]KAJ5714363.1 hypothetical protein N7483_011544 [Penicillium malachiteum]
MVLAQCALLLVVDLMFTGFKDNAVNLLAYRAWLATLMRRFVLSSTNKDCLLSTEMNNVQSQNQWQSWIRCESARRLAYCFAIVDCLSFIFLGVDISFTAGDYGQKLPSSDILWKTRNEDQWGSFSDLLNGQSRFPGLKAFMANKF